MIRAVDRINAPADLAVSTVMISVIGNHYDAGTENLREARKRKISEPDIDATTFYLYDSGSGIWTTYLQASCSWC